MLLWVVGGCAVRAVGVDDGSRVVVGVGLGACVYDVLAGGLWVPVSGLRVSAHGGWVVVAMGMQKCAGSGCARVWRRGH